ncbi:hypothetical protein HAQ00_09315 [Acidithiobacillus caldus ATCC 51756]|jgi:hypothetical protein|uniref:SNF2-related protein n=1 Tax=Acidithiobacillus caldus TaxID=33059 RepID=UPI001C065E9F|nr:helicase-related protein [Acidithiobacillus caldus]MBU2735918.1 hypothetical protein [Acidithiobacillus caldus ATCC 51756]MBU2803160.1 hypothetical protein [Acidithiobacillus caldus]
MMQVKKQSMEAFMTDWGPLFFQEAQKVMVPYYDPAAESSAKWDKVVDVMPKLREPFPDQGMAIAALAAHLYGRDKKGAFLCADMGTGKTLMSTLAAGLASHLGRPRRTIVVAPPHMVSKWVREIEMTLPGIRVVNINGPHAISVLQKEVLANPKQPQVPEFWVVGRVRARMGYRRRSGLQRLTPRILDLGGVTADHVCPDCGRQVVVRLTEKKAEQMQEQYGHRIRRFGDDETGEGLQYIWFPDADYFTAGRRTCDWVYDKGEVQPGCKAQLWQAARADRQDVRTLREKALASIDGIGAISARKVMEGGEAEKVLSFLESGIVPDALIRIIGRAAATRVQKHLDTHGFFSADADYAVAEFIKRKVPRGWFHLAIFDEVHELDGDNTAQGIAMGVIASQVEKAIALTGTLVDGYAGSLFPLLFRMYPKQMLAAGYTAHDAALFQQEMGIIKQVDEEEEEDNFRRSKGRKKSKTQIRNLPGLDPMVITDFILPNAIFIELKDMEAGIQRIAKKFGKTVQLLPSYRETFVTLEPNPADKEQLQKFTTDMSVLVKESIAQGNRRLAGKAFFYLTYAPDGAFREMECGGEVFVPTDPGAITPKEQLLVDLARREAAQGRRVLAFTIYPGKQDLITRYKEVLQEAGLRVAALRQSVPTGKREEWIRDAMGKGLDVLLCNPELVKTGLDLLGFPTLVFLQTGWSTTTVLQAMKRSWRLGQTQPVRTYILGYKATGQMVPVKLVAKKIAVANQSKGDIAKNSMSHLIDEGDGSMLTMANLILDEMRETNHDPIVGQITSLAEDRLDGEYGATPMSVIADLMRMEISSKRGDQPKVQEGLLSGDPILAQIFAQARQANAEREIVPQAPQPKARKKQIGGLITIEDPYDLF